ncbi:MAG: hypothetical protein HYY93_02525 [Planctomycetes bacterium]|nr:hypothetical protein [Planctomycetota bacterium]
MGHSITRRTIVAISLVLGIGGAAALPGQEAGKVTLTTKLKAGDKWQVSSELYLDMDLRTTDVEKESKFRKVVRQRSERYVRTFTEVKDGAPIREQIEYLSCREGESQSPNVPVEFKTTPLSGQTVSLTMDGKKLVSSVLSGAKVDPAELDGIKMIEEYAALLPKRPVGVDDVWPVPNEEAVRLVIGGRKGVPTEGSVSCKLKSLETRDGRQLAHLSIDLLRLKQVPRPGYEMTLKASNGELLFDVAAGRPVSLKISGTYDMKGAEDDVNGARIADMVGRGSWSCSVTFEPPPP